MKRSLLALVLLFGLLATSVHVLYAQSTPTDPQFASQWNWALAGGQCTSVLTTAQQSAVPIYVIDSGAPPPDSPEMDIVLASARGVMNNGGYELPPIDPGSPSFYHGTAVMSVIGAQWNNKGIAGLMPNAQLHSVRVDFGIGGIGQTLAAIDQVVQRHPGGPGVMVLSQEWANSSFDQMAFDTLQRAGQDGLLVVVGAGNSSLSEPAYPGRYENQLSNVLSVGAIDRDSLKPSFSNTGAIYAPGASMPGPVPGYPTLYWSGTSASAPHVGAVAAAWFALHPSASPAEARAALLDSARSTPWGGKVLDGCEVLADDPPPPTPSPQPGDTTAPRVTMTTPASGQSGVSISTEIKVVFSEDVQQATLLAGFRSPVSGNLTYDPATRTLTYRPFAPLTPGTSYTVTLTGDIKDLAGNSLVPYSWSFTTVSRSGSQKIPWAYLPVMNR